MTLFGHTPNPPWLQKAATESKSSASSRLISVPKEGTGSPEDGSKDLDYDGGVGFNLAL